MLRKKSCGAQKVGVRRIKAKSAKGQWVWGRYASAESSVKVTDAGGQNAMGREQTHLGRGRERVASNYAAFFNECS